MTEALRHRLYLISLAVIGVVSAYGIIAADTIPVWTALITAVFGVATNALAAKNTKG
jgi:hypothetical protein